MQGRNVRCLVLYSMLVDTKTSIDEISSKLLVPILSFSQDFDATATCKLIWHVVLIMSNPSALTLNSDACTSKLPHNIHTRFHTSFGHLHPFVVVSAQAMMAFSHTHKKHKSIVHLVPEALVDCAFPSSSFPVLFFNLPFSLAVPFLSLCNCMMVSCGSLFT